MRRTRPAAVRERRARRRQALQAAVCVVEELTGCDQANLARVPTWTVQGYVSSL